jgi:hypothetical protein
MYQILFQNVANASSAQAGRQTYVEKFGPLKEKVSCPTVLAVSNAKVKIFITLWVLIAFDGSQLLNRGFCRWGLRHFRSTQS